MYVTFFTFHAVFFRVLLLNCDNSHAANEPKYIAPHKHVLLLRSEDFFLNGMPYDATSTPWQHIALQSLTVKTLQN